MKLNSVSVLIGGEAGAGISRSGYLFGKACVRGGLHVFGANDYGSLIRGGHNFFVLRVEAGEVYSQGDAVDLVVALNKDTILRHRNELASGGGIVYDGEQVKLEAGELGRTDVQLFSVPFRSIVKSLGAQEIVENTVALGAAVALLGYELEALSGVLKDTFSEKVAETNMRAAKAGYDHAKANYDGQFGYGLRRLPGAEKGRIFVLGNEAVGMGALKAGCKFYSAYPMTPVTGLLHFMASNERDYRMVLLQAENEIACVNMVTGAAFAGARAMTATSGGGFCLMVECLGMAGMTENPIVVVLGQRTGPSTGLPTYTAQGDLRFAMHASQGEFPRMVIAPGDAEECFYETMRAFNFAEKYQMPVIILTDKYLAESQYTIEPFDVGLVKIERGDLFQGPEYQGSEYKRHLLTESGISPRVLPGTRNAIVRTNADEHDERGLTAEDAEMTTRMMDKRLGKLKALKEELRSVETVKLYGPKRADLTIVSWGSTKGPIREAMKILGKEGLKVNFVHVLYLCPFPAEEFIRHLKSARKTVVVENNATSQLAGLIRQHTLMDVDSKVLKYDGRPFDPGFLAGKLKEVA